MKRYALVTACNKSKEVLQMIGIDKILLCYDNNFVKWGTELASGITVLSPSKCLEEYKEGSINAFLIPGSLNPRTHDELISQLLAYGVDDADIYINGPKGEVCHYKSIHALGYLEIAVTEHCNLNCKSCSHFAPLVKNPVFYELDRFKSDLAKVREYVDYIAEIRILGGEPLLNINLGSYVRYVRMLYPYSEIKIVTNGILLQSMSEELINAIKETDVCIDLTVYPIILDKLDKIIGFLKDNEIKVNITGYVAKFNKILEPKEKKVPTGVRKDVHRCLCTNLYNGQLSICPVVMFVHRINERFDTDYPSGGIINIYDKGLDSEKLMNYLQQTIPLCNYCGVFWANPGDGEPWNIYRNEIPKLDDWIINN